MTTDALALALAKGEPAPKYGVTGGAGVTGANSVPPLNPRKPPVYAVTPVTPGKRQAGREGGTSTELGRVEPADEIEERAAIISETCPAPYARHFRAPEPSKADGGFGRAMVASPRRRGPVPRRLGGRSGGDAMERGRVVRHTARRAAWRHRLAVEGRKGRRPGRGSCSPERRASDCARRSPARRNQDRGIIWRARNRPTSKDRSPIDGQKATTWACCSRPFLLKTGAKSSGDCGGGEGGDATARAWLAQYLIGKPGLTAPAPLTVVVQQLSGRDPLTERLAKPYVDRRKYPSLSANEGFEDAMRELIAGELRVLKANNLNTRETGVNADGARLPADSATS